MNRRSSTRSQSRPRPRLGWVSFNFLHSCTSGQAAPKTSSSSPAGSRVTSSGNSRLRRVLRLPWPRQTEHHPGPSSERHNAGSLNTWQSPTDSCSTPSAGRPSSIRRSWRSFSASRHATVHRTLTDLLSQGIVGRVSHGTAHLASSQRYYPTAQGIREVAGFLGFGTLSDFVRAYPVSREWLTLLIRRMDAVAAVYRLAASLSPGIDGLRSHVEFHRRGRFDAAITLHDGRSFAVVRQGIALRRRSLYDRLRAIAQCSHGRRPGTVLILAPSAWELRRTARFCINNDLRDCYVAVESRDALERRDLRLWCEPTGLFGLTYYTLETVSSHGRPGGGSRTASPERKRASLPRPERMAQAAPAFGVSPSEKRTLDLITDPCAFKRVARRQVGDGPVQRMLPALVETALEVLRDTLLRGLWCLTRVILALGWCPGAGVLRNRTRITGSGFLLPTAQRPAPRV